MFNVFILTPQEVYLKGQAIGVIAPGLDGYLEILTDHASLITVLKEGEVVVIQPDKKELSFKITGGLLEVHQNQLSLLADDIEVLKTPHIVVSGLT